MLLLVLRLLEVVHSSLNLLLMLNRRLLAIMQLLLLSHWSGSTSLLLLSHWLLTSLLLSHWTRSLILNGLLLMSHWTRSLILYCLLLLLSHLSLS